MLAAASHGGPGTIRLVLIGAGIALAYLLLVLAHPLVTCPRCFGKRMIRPRRKKRQRRRTRSRRCWLCNAKGIYRLPGATAIHRFFWSVLGEHIRSRRRDEAAAKAEARREA